MDLSDIFGDRDVEWMDDAACGDHEAPDIFFPVRDKETYKSIADEAKAYCFGGNGASACPVRNKCLWYAIESDEQHGIWGGLSHRERNALVRKWQKSHRKDMSLKDFVFQHKAKGK